MQVLANFSLRAPHLLVGLGGGLEHILLDVLDHLLGIQIQILDFGVDLIAQLAAGCLQLGHDPTHLAQQGRQVLGAHENEHHQRDNDKLGPTYSEHCLYPLIPNSVVLAQRFLDGFHGGLDSRQVLFLSARNFCHAVGQFQYPLGPLALLVMGKI